MKPLKHRPAARATADSRSHAALHLDAPDMIQRLDLMEDALQEIRQSLSVQFKRIAAIQAQLDHMVAKQRG